MPIHPKTVYLVEDSAVLAERLVAEIVEMGGEIAGTASRASAAIEFLNRQTPDILILDLALEQSSGFEVLRHLKQAALRPFIVVLSNHAGSAIRNHCRQAGADLVFDKASEIGGFLSAVRDRIEEIETALS